MCSKIITEDFSLTLRSLKLFIDLTETFQIPKPGYTSMWAYKWFEMVPKKVISVWFDFVSMIRMVQDKVEACSVNF